MSHLAVRTDPAEPPAADGPRRLDPAAWIRRHQGRVFAYLRYLRCPRDHAEDLLQEAFTRALDRPALLAAPDRRADAWLRTTARNLWFEELRRQRRRPEVDDPEALERVWLEDAPDDARQQALSRCLETLGRRGRDVIERRYADGWSRDELARHLGVGAHGVKSLLRRLRAALRDCIDRRTK